MKPIKNIQRYLDQSTYTVCLIFDDDSYRNIFIQRGMIFVADCSLPELDRRIEAGDTESFESYDTSDGCSYYKCSEYADEISDALLCLVNRLM